MKINPKVIYPILILIGLMFGLLLIEITLQIIQLAGDHQFLGLRPLRTTITWQKDDPFKRFLLTPTIQGWIVTPSKEYFNWVITNKEGFYDTNHQVEKPSDTFRILLLGDSFVANIQTPLEQTYAKQLEYYLNNLKLDKKFEIISMGLGDTGSVQQYQALEKLGLKYQPDLVVQMFLTANDLKNNLYNLQKDPFRNYLTFQDNKLVELPAKSKSTTIKSKITNIIKQSSLIQLLLSLRQNIQENKSNRQNVYPLDYHVYDISYNSDYEQSWQTTQNIILHTKKLVEDNGAKYVLVILANNEQVNNAVWIGQENNYPLLKTNTDLTKPDKLFGEFCSVSNVDCLFMRPFFEEYKKHNPSQPTHYKYDGHWNEVGNKLVTDFLIINLSNYFFMR